MINVFVEVSGVRPCGNQQGHDSAVPALVVAFLHPLAYLSAVWRVAEHSLPPPRLFQSVIIRREESLALRRFRQGARIQRKVKLLVQFVEEVLRRGPVHPVA